MQTQHAFDPRRWTPQPLRLGIDRLDRRHEVRPRDNTIHLIEKPLATGGFALLFKRRVCKGLLLHGPRLPFSAAFLIAHH